MYLKIDSQWQGTARDLAADLRKQVQTLGLAIDPPALRTVRLWRSKQLLSQRKGKKFGSRQILEGLATAILLKKGWTLAAIGQVLPTFTNTDLEQQIVAEAKGLHSIWTPNTRPTSSPSDNHQRQMNALAEDAVVLLAQGIIRQYTQVLNREIVRQDDHMPAEMYQAMCKLGRLYIEQGLPDEAACIHTVLNRCRFCFSSDAWKLTLFHQSSFRFSEVELIDPTLRVPTSDCTEIALLSGGFGENNVIEDRLHRELRDNTEQLGLRRKHKAYRALRELIARHSLISEKQVWGYLEAHDLTPLQSLVVDTFFDSVPDIWLFEGLAHQCAHCNTLMRPHPNSKQFPEGRCPIRQCDRVNPPTVSKKLDAKKHHLLIAKPQLLTYWTGPAIDELTIFDAAKRQGLDAELFPESDLADISIDDRDVGIDAKSYLSPVSLALKLNRGIGGLINYRRKIIAVSDQLIENDPYYLSTLRNTLDKEKSSAALEVLSVSQVLKLLPKLHYAN